MVTSSYLSRSFLAENRSVEYFGEIFKMYEKELKMKRAILDDIMSHQFAPGSDITAESGVSL